MLVKFFSNPQTKAYLREIAEEFGESTNSVRVELNRLSQAKLLLSEPDGRTIKYSANQNHPLFPDIRQIISKFLGLDQIAQNIVRKLGDVEAAFVIGDYARGIDSGTIELVIIGHKINPVQLEELSAKASKLINRKIVPVVLSKEQFELKVQNAGINDTVGSFYQPIIIYTSN